MSYGINLSLSWWASTETLRGEWAGPVDGTNVQAKLITVNEQTDDDIMHP